MNKPEKKKIPKRKKYDSVIAVVMDLHKNIGYNQACDEYDKFLPSEEEIAEILGQCYTTKENQWKQVDSTLMKTIVSAISKRIRGEK